MTCLLHQDCTDPCSIQRVVASEIRERANEVRKKLFEISYRRQGVKTRKMNPRSFRDFCAMPLDYEAGE